MIVFFGVGNIASKTIEKYGFLPDFIVDNNEAVHGSQWEGRDVRAPAEILKHDVNRVLVCTTSYLEVIQQLIEMGVEPEKIEVTKVLDSIRVIDEIESLTFDLLFVSGVPSHEKKHTGGGLYRLRGNLENYELERLYAGNCHAVSKGVNDSFVVTDNNDTLLIYNMQCELVDQVKIDPGMRPHGCVCLQDGGFLVACSYDDSVRHIGQDGKTIRVFRFSSQLANTGTAQHHVNDVSFYKGYAYASMFSVSGAWRCGFLDGGIVRINIETGEQHTVLSNLSMPHNIRVGSHGYYVCNSYEGQLLENNGNVLFQSNGFVRGLEIIDNFYIVCESKNRNFANVRGGPQNPCLDSRINFIHKRSGAYRSVQLPFGLTEIHSVLHL